MWKRRLCLFGIYFNWLHMVKSAWILDSLLLKPLTHLETILSIMSQLPKRYRLLKIWMPSKQSISSRKRIVSCIITGALIVIFIRHLTKAKSITSWVSLTCVSNYSYSSTIVLNKDLAVIESADTLAIASMTCWQVSVEYLPERTVSYTLFIMLLAKSSEPLEIWVIVKFATCLSYSLVVVVNRLRI